MLYNSAYITLHCNVSFSWASEQQRKARIIIFKDFFLANSFSHTDFHWSLTSMGVIDQIWLLPGCTHFIIEGSWDIVHSKGGISGWLICHNKVIVIFAVKNTWYFKACFKRITRINFLDGGERALLYIEYWF